MASKSALMAQMQANMRAAAQRAKEREDDTTLAEQAAIAAAVVEATQASKEMQKETLPVITDREALQPVVSEPQLAIDVDPLTDAELRLKSLSPIAIEVGKLLIKAKSFINLAHVNIPGKRGRIPYETIRSAVRRLDRENFFLFRGVGNYGVLKGMTYVLNAEVTKLFMQMYGTEQEASQQPLIVPVKQVALPAKEKADDFLGHPELTQWRNSGLSEKQVNLWVAEFNIDRELLLQYMKWCAYDVANNHADNPVKNISNWFYSIMKNTGGYPKPDGYMSIEDKRIADLEKLRAEQAARKEREAQEMQDSIDRGIKDYFDQVMAEGEANELYAELRDGLNDFSRRLEKVPGNPVFRAAMWTAFKSKAGL